MLETIIYASLLFVILGVIANALFALSFSYKHAKNSRLIEEAGVVALDSMLREIRSSRSVNLGESIFDSNPGKISLSSLNEDGSLRTVIFALNSGTLEISENGATAIPLTSNEVTISSLIFKYSSSTNSEAIGVKIETTSGEGVFQKSEKWQSFSVLRGSY